jgi:hypothetical protein
MQGLPHSVDDWLTPAHSPHTQARLALDPAAAAAALVALKAAYPGADMAAVVTVKPHLLLQSPEELAANAAQVGEGAEVCSEGRGVRRAGNVW